jgi:hypothetical protein
MTKEQPTGAEGLYRSIIENARTEAEEEHRVRLSGDPLAVSLVKALKERKLTRGQIISVHNAVLAVAEGDSDRLSNRRNFLMGGLLTLAKSRTTSNQNLAQLADAVAEHASRGGDWGSILNMVSAGLHSGTIEPNRLGRLITNASWLLRKANEEGHDTQQIGSILAEGFRKGEITHRTFKRTSGRLLRHSRGMTHPKRDKWLAEFRERLEHEPLDRLLPHEARRGHEPIRKKKPKHPEPDWKKRKKRKRK